MLLNSFVFDRNRLMGLLTMCGVLTVSCTGSVAPQKNEPVATGVAVHVRQVAQTVPSACAGLFIEHPLDFMTSTASGTVKNFESNGSGVAAGDLNGDGLIDLVFANLGQPAVIFWNDGHLNFRKQALDVMDVRAPAIVDVDGDGQPDIVFTQRFGPPFWMRNRGGEFERVNLGNVFEPAYSMAWADLNGDGRLDLVTASYNAELAKEQANNFLFNRIGGVMVYTNLGDAQFSATKISPEAQGLALLVTDLNHDGRPDIWVGNDFDVMDEIWLNTTAGWVKSTMQPATSHSTMSLSVADIDNSGMPAVFESDMKPYDVGVHTMVEWLPLMQTMRKSQPKDDPQVQENVLMQQRGNGTWQNRAPDMGVDATGWTWSAQFGDLDQDGFVDLYTVNGMIDRDFFRHLPNTELVEQNRAFRNLGGSGFALADDWGLASTSSGRGMIMVDLDNDGDLDIVINNLLAPAQVFENRLCSGSSLEVQLQQPGSNHFGVGARLELQTSMGTMTRDVHVGSGHISADAPRVHFGLPKDATINKLVVTWPDGIASSVPSPAPNQIIEVTR